MPKISQTTIEEVSSRINLVDLVSEYTKLDKKGDDFWGCCPFHNEKTASFHVMPDKKMYYCFGCRVGGGAIKFYMEMEKVSYIEAIKTLAKKTGTEIVYESGFVNIEEKSEINIKEQYKELYTRVSKSFRYLLISSDMGKFALEYLKKRGVSEEIAEKFQLGYSPANRYWLKKFLISKNYTEEFLDESGLFSKKFSDVAFFSDRLMFPICDRMGKVIAFGGRLLHGDGPKYLNSGDLIQYKKGENLFAFNIAKKTIRDKKAAIICEGYMDVIAYHQAGISNAVAPLGTALTEEQLKLLHTFADTIYLSFDSDEAGQKATWKSILLARRQNFNVRVIKLQGGKDPSEILQTSGVDTLTSYVQTAILDVDFLLSVLSKKYSVETPEGKTRASLEFFQYIDVLQSDIQKESCLELLSQTYQLKPEAVKADYLNRDSALKKIDQKDNNRVNGVNDGLKLNAELRAVMAVVSNLNFYSLMRNSLTADDFVDITARNMFISLEECYREDTLDPAGIQEKCSDEALRNEIAKTIASHEFSDNTEKTVSDCIRIIKYNSLERKRDKLVNRIRQFTAVTLEEQQLLNSMINEKMNIDAELLQLKDARE